MNWDQIVDNWEPFRGKLKEKWPLLTDDDLTAIAGKRGPLVDLLQVRYDYDKAQVERELDELVRTLKPVKIPEPEPADTGATLTSGDGTNLSLRALQTTENPSYRGGPS